MLVLRVTIVPLARRQDANGTVRPPRFPPVRILLESTAVPDEQHVDNILKFTPPPCGHVAPGVWTPSCLRRLGDQRSPLAWGVTGVVLSGMPTYA